MKNIKFVLVTLFLAMFLITSEVFSNQGSYDPVIENPETIKMRFAATLAESDPQTQAFIRFADLINKKTNGTIDITVFPASELGDEQSVVESMQLGTIEIACTGYTGSEMYDLEYLPYLYKNKDHFFEVFRGEIGQILAEKQVKELGLRPLDAAVIGFGVVTSNKYFRTPGEAKGLKIRLMQMPVILDTWDAIGGNPVPMAWPEVFGALQTGTIDAQENPPSIAKSSHFYEVTDYLILTNHQLHAMFVQIAEPVYQKMSKEVQELFVNTLNEVMDDLAEKIIEETEETIAFLAEQGMEIVYPDIEAFREITKDVWKDHAPRVWGDGVYEAIRELGGKYVD